MTIRIRLLLAFGAIALLLAIGGYLYHKSLRGIDRAYNDVALVTLPVVQALQDLRFAGLRIVSSTSEYALIHAERHGPAESAETREQELIVEGRSGLDSAFARSHLLVATVRPELSAWLDTLARTGSELSRVSDRLVALLDRNAPGVVVLAQKEQFEVLETRYLTSVDRALAGELARLSERHRALDRHLAAALRSAYGLALLGLAIVCLIGFSVYWSVTRPLGELTAGVRSIRAGQLDVRIKLTSTDEVGVLAAAFNEMAEALRATFVRLNDTAGDLAAARDEAEAAATRYRLLFEGNPEAIWVYDTETLRFLAVNEAALERYGYERERFLAMTVPDVLATGELPAAGDGNAALRRHRRRDGRVLEVEETAHDLTIQGRPARIVLAQDRTERRRLEDQLRQAQKMEAIGRLSGGVAHDFNNMLTAIISYTDLLLADIPVEDARRRDVAEIRRSADRAASLTRQLLAFSRRQILQTKVLDLNDVVRQAEGLLRRLIGEDIELITRVAPGLGLVKVDPSQLEQVIVNLAVNARDAMARGGKLTIETAEVDLDEAAAREHFAITPGRYALLAVSDTGVGMDAETQAHLFEPFFTTKEKGKGTGLGLATVYGVVKQSGGYVAVQSALGQGTTFRVYLPVVDAPVDGAEERPVAGGTRRGTETVVLVEDEAAVREVARQVLTRHGYRVLEAESGETALRIAVEHNGPIHLLFTDVVMPVMGGAELAQRFTTLRPETRVLFASGYMDDTVVRHGIQEADLAFLPKPYTMEALTRKVREVLASP